jgi:spermidine/putrescine transport system permease protein
MKKIKLFKVSLVSSFSLWLTLFALLPLLLIALVSIMQQDTQMALNFRFTLANYAHVFDPLYVKIFLRSIGLALLCTLLCLLIAYPFAYGLARVGNKYKQLLLLLVIIPFWTSSLVRSYAMLALLKTKGLVNSVLLSLGIIDAPLQIIYTNTAVLISLVYNLLPFMVLPLYTNMEKLDYRLLEAARDLGANAFTTFVKVLLPLTVMGIVAGSILVFLPAMTLFYIPDFMGGAKSLLLGNLIQHRFLMSQNWPEGTALSMVLTVMMGLLIWLYWSINRHKLRQEWL